MDISDQKNRVSGREKVKKEQNRKKIDRGIPLLLSILLVFCILGTVVFSVARKISVEMSDSAIQNLSESLDLIKCTIEAVFKKDAEFQKLMAKEIGMAKDPENYIRSYQKNRSMVKVSLILSGKTTGISNTGEAFSEEGLD